MQVLQQLRDDAAEHSTQLERVMQRQHNRFMTMVAGAVFLSVAALVAVVVMGYLMLSRGH